MVTEVTNKKENTAKDVALSAPASRSMTEIAFGIISFLVATAFGWYLGKNIGGWGDKPFERYMGKEYAAEHTASNVFGAIMAIFTGSIAAHANLSNPSKPEQEKSPAVTPKTESKSENVKPIVGENQPVPTATVAGAALHDGNVAVASSKVAI